MKVFKTGSRGEGESGGKNPLLSSPRLPVSQSPRHSDGGWTLIELVITMTVLTILTLGVIPLVRTSVRRQREQRLHEALREMRNAVDEFHRDTVLMRCGPLAGGVAGLPQQANPNPNPNPQGVVPGSPAGSYLDPRSRVVISDCTIFGVDNPDHYPPDLQTLVDGVDVVPRAGAVGAVAGAGLDSVGGSATQNSGGLIPKKKVYLREIPIDPITGERDWCTLSNYDPPDEGCSGSTANVFDVRSKARGEALNGEKYVDW
jgi:type II secretory pathway pseudopilin PulG